MQTVAFTKMAGTGNDFIVVDNRAGILDEIGVQAFARAVCARHVSLGADELIVIDPPSAGGDFTMRTINPDGAEVKMCGNAARCVARYAVLHGFAGPEMTIDTLGGPVDAWVEGERAWVRLQVTSAPRLHHALTVEGEAHVVHTIAVSGAPHAVLYRDDVPDAPDALIQRLGAAIRQHPDFPDGVNVNFVQALDRHTLWQRTYERGVEGETLACGSGAAASAVVSGLLGRVDAPVRLRVRGGELGVSFERQGESFTNQLLSGDARFVAEGTLHPEAWAWTASS
jgi:diaminopimelate epimerase